MALDRTEEGTRVLWWNVLGGFDWDTAGERIACRVDQVTVFEDSQDHWRNGLRRLLMLDEATARKWVESVARKTNELFDRRWSE